MKAIALIIALLMLLLTTGCMDPQTRAAITQIQDTAKIAEAKSAADAKAAKNAADVAALAAEAAAETQPTSHPIEWANVIIGQIAGPTKFLAFAASAACLVGIGMWIASYFFAGVAILLASFGKLAAILGFVVGSGCWLILFLLPWALWIVAADILAVIGVVLFFLAQHHWSLKQAWGSLDATPSQPNISASLATKGIITAPQPVSEKLTISPTPIPQ